MDIESNLISRLYNAKESEWEHKVYYYEQQLLDYVKRGETEKLKKHLSQPMTLKEEFILSDSLRQFKNIFIGLINMVGKEGAIRGGVPIEETYQLIEIYVQECERLNLINEVTILQNNMLLDFASRVEKTQIPGDYSGEVFACVQFIKAHTNKIIAVDDVADYVQKSRSYITRKFKNEMGISIGCFIMFTKLEEAKSLLVYSGKSLSEISTYLCFSSQSYFQNVFKKQYGTTPGQFKKHALSRMRH